MKINNRKTGKKIDILEYLEEKYSRYSDYYETLNIDPKNAKDEIVKEHYESQLKQIDMFLMKSEKKYGKERIERVKESAHNALENAYSALKSEDSRKHYNELLDEISR